MVGGFLVGWQTHFADLPCSGMHTHNNLQMRHCWSDMPESAFLYSTNSYAISSNHGYIDARICLATTP
jgi:hypothetical protein